MNIRSGEASCKYDCPDRSITCHASCKKYEAFKKRCEAANKLRDSRRIVSEYGSEAAKKKHRRLKGRNEK